MAQLARVSWTVHCLAQDDSRLPSGLTGHEYMGETGALCNLTLPSFPPLLHYPPATAQPQLCGVMSTVSWHSRVKCVVHARLPVTFRVRVRDESRDLKFSYREIKFSKINIPRRVAKLEFNVPTYTHCTQYL